MAKCLFQSGGGKSNLKVVTATANDVLKGKVIVDANGNPLTGTIESMGAQTITPSNTNKTVSCNGKYMTGDVSVKGDSNLVAGNIISGKTIFGVAGNAKKFATIATHANSGTALKDFNSKSGSKKVYHVDVSLGFHPTVFEYAAYKVGYIYCGITCDDGTFVTHIGATDVSFYIDKNIVSGTNLYMPCNASNKFCDICAAGYY